MPDLAAAGQHALVTSPGCHAGRPYPAIRHAQARDPATQALTPPGVRLDAGALPAFLLQVCKAFGKPHAAECIATQVCVCACCAHLRLQSSDALVAVKVGELLGQAYSYGLVCSDELQCLVRFVSKQLHQWLS